MYPQAGPGLYTRPEVIHMLLVFIAGREAPAVRVIGPDVPVQRVCPEVRECEMRGWG